MISESATRRQLAMSCGRWVALASSTKRLRVRISMDRARSAGKCSSVSTWNPQDTEVDAPMDIVGLVRDSVYDNLREPMRPTVFVPHEAANHAALVVRTTTGDPLALGSTLRRRVTQIRSDFRVTNVGTQSAFVQRQMLRERLLASLSLSSPWLHSCSRVWVSMACSTTR